MVFGCHQLIEGVSPNIYGLVVATRRFHPVPPSPWDEQTAVGLQLAPFDPPSSHFLDGFVVVRRGVVAVETEDRLASHVAGGGS